MAKKVNAPKKKFQEHEPQKRRTAWLMQEETIAFKPRLHWLPHKVPNSLTPFRKKNLTQVTLERIWP